MRRRNWRWLTLVPLAALVGLGAACDEGTTTPAEDGVEEAELRFLRFPEDLKPLATMDTSFWAVQGRNTEFVLRYAPEPGEDEGEEFLTFRIRDFGLYRRPNGDRFAEGDSIEIHLTVDADGRFLFDFEPSGLEFDPDEPAELEVEYRRLEGDLDGDGDTDSEDEELENDLQIWKQETPGGLWYPVGTVRVKDTDELRGEITSFTGFAIAV